MQIPVTILCHGTDNSTDRATSGGSELVISKLYTLLAGVDEWDWILCEGAGTSRLRHQSTVTNIGPPTDPFSGPLQDVFADHIAQGGQHPGANQGLVGMPQARTFSHRLSHGLAATAHSVSHGLSARADRVKGIAVGKGVEANVERALDFVAKRGTKNLRVNLAGHSRGSITCYKIAHALYEKYRYSVAVNIFAIDPVPGNTGSKNEKMYSHIKIQPNVQYSFLMMAESEHRQTFRGYIDELYSQGGSYGHEFDTMPGTHGGINELTGSESEAAALVLSRAVRFLKDRGTPLTNEASRFILDENGDHAFGALRMYCKLMMRIKNYKAHASVNPFGKSPEHGLKAAAGDHLNRVANLAMSSLSVEKHRIVNVAGPKDTWGTDGHQVADADTRGREDHHGLRMSEALRRMQVDPHAERADRFFANKEHEELFERLYPGFFKGVRDLEGGATPQKVIAMQTAIANANETYNRMSPDTQAYFYAFCQARGVLP